MNTLKDLSNQNIMIAPANDLAYKLNDYIITKYDIYINGFIDNTKKSDKVYPLMGLKYINIDIVFVISPIHSKEIAQNILNYNSKIKIIFIEETKNSTNPYKIISNQTIIFKDLKLKTKFIFTKISKFINIINMLLVFLIKPKILYKLSWTNALPSENGKDKEANNLKELYNLHATTNFVFEKNKYNLYTRGSDSYNISKYDILIHISVNERNKNGIFATADKGMLKYYLKEKVDVIYTELTLVNSLNEHRTSNKLDDDIECKIIKLFIHSDNDAKYITYGSGLATILSFYTLSDSIKVYGLNHYSEKKQSTMNYFEFFKTVFFYERDFRSYDYIEYSLLHLFLAYYFNKSPNIEVYGNIDYFNNKQFDKIFTKRLKQIFLK